MAQRRRTKARGDRRVRDLARTGRLLVANLRCVKCHTEAPAFDQAKNTAIPMPELTMDAPSFQDIGQRLRRDWMTNWIDNPQVMRPGAHMPRVFKDGAPGKPDARAMDVAAYLASLSAAAPGAPEPAPDAETVKVGGRLYASLFCVACHSPPNAAPEADKGRIPHRHVAAKFTPSGLRAYLLNPEAHYAWNPMPNFRLSETEATALAAFLMSNAQPAPAPAAGGDAKKGEALVTSSGCYNCHSAGAPGTVTASNLKAPSLAELPAEKWTHGCLAENPADAKNAPHYTLTAQDLQALRAFAATDRSSLNRDTADEFSNRQWATMRCGACHSRDAEPAAITAALGDEVMDLYKSYFPDAGAPAPNTGFRGMLQSPNPAAAITAFLAAPPAAAHPDGDALAPDQRALPLMTWAGEKLRPEWSAAFIHGDIAYKPRPYLRARMPAFPVRAIGLAHGMAAEHGFAFKSEPSPAPDPALVPLGQRLVGQVGGFSCVQCHAVAQRPPLAPFEAPSVNFAYVSQRLRKEYYDRWMWNPIRVDPGTKMPQFGDFEGNTAIKDVLGGDAAKQYEAIWNYLLQGKDVKPPG